MPSVPSITTVSPGSRVIEQAGDGENRRQAERARHDRGMAFGAAEDGGEPGDALRVHQRGVGRGQLLGEDDGALRHGRIGDVRLLDQIADEPRADDPDVLDPRRQIGIAHRGEALGDLVDLDLDRALGIDPRLARCAGRRRGRGASSTASRDARRAGSRPLRRRIRASAEALVFSLRSCLQRNRDRLGKTAALGFDLGLRDMALADRKARRPRRYRRGPMAIPGDTPRPGNRRSARDPRPRRRRRARQSSSNLHSISLASAVTAASASRPGGGELDDRARRGRQHHQPHDRAARHLGAVLAHPDLGVELRGGLDKAGGGARMQPTLVADRRDPPTPCPAAGAEHPSASRRAGRSLIGGRRSAAGKRR